MLLHISELGRASHCFFFCFFFYCTTWHSHSSLKINCKFLTAASAPNILPTMCCFFFGLPLFHCPKEQNSYLLISFTMKTDNAAQNTTNSFSGQTAFSESTLFAISVKWNILTTLLLYALITMNPSVFNLTQRLISIKNVLNLTNTEAFLSLIIDIYFLQLNLIWLPADNRSFKS